ncbi:MAG: cyclomaltodextrinase [Lachnospiraceae bacterium]|nr:cyclomaltodextrinase [Lachnospiraceae bacterium]
MWAEEAVFYQFYPLGVTGAPFENDGVLTHRILQIKEWIPHLVKLGINAVYFSPLFESDTHGYNTRDYRKIDTRLGTNDDFKEVVDALHEADIKVVLDGVFNHVGRGFFAFLDVKEKRQASPYCSWFQQISFEGNSNYNDGFWYEGWEGNYDLVKLNLKNPAVTDYLFESVKMWIDEWGIDGLRLDVAYMVDRDFLRELRRRTDEWKDDFYLIGEMIGGDYNQIMGDMCHSVTNYECRKGIFSALNSDNLFEIVHSLMRQFGPENWTLYNGKHLMAFVDNHDVSRIATEITDKKKLPLAYGFVFGMPGIPCVYYGSEWGLEGDKKNGDPSLRPEIKEPEWTALTDTISNMAKAHHGSKALCYGDFKSVLLENTHCIFQRKFEDERVLVAMNITGEEYTAHFDAGCGMAEDLISGAHIDFGGGLKIPPYTVYFMKMEK